MGDKFYKFVASGCYLGLSPIAPGTCGTLIGVILSIIIYKTSGSVIIEGFILNYLYKILHKNKL